MPTAAGLKGESSSTGAVPHQDGLATGVSVGLHIASAKPAVVDCGSGNRMGVGLWKAALAAVLQTPDFKPAHRAG